MATIKELMTDLLEEGCYYLRRNMPEMVFTVDPCIGSALMKLLDCYFVKYIESEIKKITPEQITELEKQIKSIYFFCFIWSIGATTNAVGRERFNKWLRERMAKHGLKEFPEEKAIYDWQYDVSKSEWVSWYDTIEEYLVDISKSYSEIVVPTQDSIRMKYLMKTLISNDKHVLMPGPTGTGKSVYVSELVTFQMPEEFQTLTMCFSAQTSANQTQDYLDDKFEKRRKGVYGPPLGKKYIVFVDDLNMPAQEEYFAQPPIELLRQFMDYSGWYERDSKEKPFNLIVDIILVSAMGPPGGGRAQVTQRLQRHFNIIAYTDMSFEAIQTIFTTIVGAFFRGFSNDIKDSVDQLIQAQIEVYD